MGASSRVEEKLAELRCGLVTALRIAATEADAQALESAATAVLQSGVSVTEPEIPPPVYHMITAQSLADHDEAASTKPGHIRFRLGEVLEACCSGALTVVGITQPWLLPLAALLLWRAIWRSATVELTADEATAVISVWELSRQDGVRTTIDAVHARVNNRRSEVGLTPLSKQRLRSVLGNLEKLESVEQRSDRTYRVVEWIRVAYR